MNRILRIGIVFTLLAGWPALAAPPADDGAEAETDADAIRDDKPHRVTVEESAPHIPRSNTIATRLDIAPLWIPFLLGTVNEPVLRDQDARVLGDALNNVSGMNPQTQSGLGDYFLVRGFDSVSSGLVLTDGAAEPELAFYQMYNVDRVEVLKGPGGFLYSRNGLSGAAAGAVNIVRRQPVPGSFTHLGLSAGSYDTFQGTVDLNRTAKNDRFGFRLNAMWGDSDYYRDDKDNDTFAVNPAFTWLVGDDTSVNVNLEYVDADYQPDSGLPLADGELADVSRTRSYQSPFDRSDQSISRFQVDVETRLSDSWVLRNKTFFRDLDWETDGTIFNGVFANPFTLRDEVSRSLTLLDNDQQFLGNQVEGVWSSNGSGFRQQILTGLEVAQYSNDFTLSLGCDPDLFTFTGQCLLPSMDLYDPVEIATDFFELPFDEGDADTVVVAPYAIYQGQFTDWFQLLAGARLDRVDFEDDVTGDEWDDTDLSPMLGLVFQPAENLSLYASAGESFAPPSARIVDDPEPEKGKQYEVGLKHEAFDGKLLTSVAAYRLERDNIPVPDENGFTQQSGDQVSKGFEVEIAAEPLPRFRAFLSYAYIDAELTRFSERVIFGPGPGDFLVVDRSGNTPAFVPDHILNLWLSKRFESGFGVGAGGRYVSSQFIAEDNEFEIDDYVVFDAAVYYNFGRWDLSLNLKNLTDEEYETRGFGSTSVIPANDFAAYGAVQYRF